jgi:hypothetical protein
MTGTASAIMSKHVASWTDLLDKDVAVALIAGAGVQAPPGQPGWHITVPPALSGEILGGAALLGLAGILVPARLALRVRPMAAFGRGE